MEKIRKLKFLLVLLLLGWANVSQAHVYWKPRTGNDSNDGSTAAKAVKTWTRAKALLSNQDNNAQIYLCERLTISSTTTLDGAISGKANARVRRNCEDFLIHVSSASATLTLKNITIYGELHSSNPHWDGVRSLIVTSGTVVLDNGAVLRDNYVRDVTEPYAGAVRLYNGSTLTMKNGSLISNCRAEHEGSDVRFEGGAIMSGGNCTVNIEGGTIENCTSSHVGGAICLRSGTYTFNMTGGTITGCSAPKGGGVYIAPILTDAETGTYSNVVATINMTGGTIQNCSATNNAGGGMYLGSTTGTITMNMSGGTIDGCTATYYGGGICVQRGTFNYTMTNGTIKNCNGSVYGGGICVEPVYQSGVMTEIKATMNISGGLFENCVATNANGTNTHGGGIFVRGNVEGSTLNMTGGKFHNCRSVTKGGGICVMNSTMVTHLTAGEIYECACYGDDLGDNNGRGGGVAFMNYTTAYIDGDNMLIHDNVCKCYGGGVQVDSYSTLYFSKGKVYNNLAGYVEEGASNGAAGLHITQSTLHMSGGEVYNNRTRAVGGGLHASYEGTMEITGGVFHDNIAEQQGGGINLNTQCHLTFPKGSTVKFYDNEAGIGGAILLDGANLTIYDGEFYGNKALDTYPTYIFDSGAGGAFCLVMDRGDSHHNDSVFPANFYMYGGDVHDNYASNHGGGLFVSKNTEHPLMGVSHITIKGGEMHENEANTGSGGGVYADAGCIFLMSADTVMDGSTISEINIPSIYENTAAQSGGGVYLTDAKFTVEAGSFLSNLANQDGGGFYIAGDTAQVAIKGGEIKFNKAQNNGGGFTVVGGTVNVEQVNSAYPIQIESDTAYVNGGGMYVSGGLVTINGGSISNNKATNNGGGFYVNVDNNTVVTTIKGGAVVGYNSATNGAGAYINKGRLDILDLATTINNNTASNKGGGIYMAAGTINLANAQILSNTAVGDGGGLYTYGEGGNVTVTGAAHINNNSARDGGGGYVNNGTLTFTGSGNGIQVNGNSATSTNTSYGNGGGFYVGGGNVNITGKCMIDGNSASDDGGGIYTTGGTMTISGENSVISHNTAAYWGGGIRAGGNVSFSNGRIFGNSANTRGGGIYVHGGTFSMTGGIIGGTTAEGNYTTAQGSMGGGIFMNAGVATVSGGSISGNYTYTHGGDANSAGKGGAIYMYGGTCTLSGGAIIGGATTEYANLSDLGGGIHSAAGIITVRGGNLSHNIAYMAGGAIYTNGTEGVVNMVEEGSKVNLSHIEYNTAPEGGGIYANRGTVNFSDGSIDHNFASEAGGGIYVNFNNSTDFGTLNLKGNAVLALNHVPAGHKGGGVYLKGRVFIGEASEGGTGSSVTAVTNYADAEGATITDDNRNNIYLPNPEVRDDHCGLITVNQGGINTTSSVGFSVETNRVPVIYCQYKADPSSYDYLDLFTTGPETHTYQNVLFDDSHRYISVHYTIYPRDRFDYDHVYLFGFWPEEVTTEPDGFSFDNIDSERDLAWLITYVNGRINNDGVLELPPHTLQDTVVNLNADLNMNLLGWVPIGTTTKPNKDDKPFMGIFNGNGHTISGINGMVYKDHYAFGLFGNIEDATIQDVFVKDAEFYLEENDTLVVGGLVGEIFGNSTVCNSEVSTLLVAVSPKTTMGGLIGRQHSGTTHSTIAISDMRGGRMGGLVGQLLGGNLYNSFSNAKFTPVSGNTQYLGGLVAENAGNVENCYMRLRGEVPTNTTFGMLVGQNQSTGSMKYNYSLVKGSSRYFADNNGTLTDYRYYDNNTEVPYTYARRDNQVHIVEGGSTHIPADYVEGQVHPSVFATGADKQMLLCLNNWVTFMNTAGGNYTYWKRPTTKVINDDLPVLMMPISEAVAATSTDPYLAYAPVNRLLSTYTAASQAIWLYKSIDGLDDNSASHAPLYIAEGLVVVPDDGASVNAYVGVTLRNTAGKNGANPTFGDGTPDFTDWHMFSSPLVAAPLGVDYAGDDTQYLFSYSHSVDAGGNPMPYYHFYDDADARGFFPSHRYGTTYDGTIQNSETAGGNYYKEWDYYTYYEPEYHWINFKRNWNSHWHENAHSVQINYNNEDEMIQGRGYLLATREETFLQCQGELNNDAIYIDATCSGYYSPGYNFLGNPYMAYLDFNAFARENAWIWGGYNKAAYAIIDEVNGGTGGYVYYAPEASVNPALATRFISPMQGFMVLAIEADEVEFNTDMRTFIDSIGDSHFRGGDVLAYPLVNLYAHDDNGNRDITTIELGRPDQGGAKLMRELKQVKCHVYCHYDNEDWAIAFTRPGLSEAAIRFEAYADGEFTMKWDTQNGDFSYLHLIDNMTGADIDCLTATEYRFTASTTDYRSRFRLVFGYTGVEEEMDDVQGQNVSFAFQSGDELVITGEGAFTMFDVTGRAVMKTETHGAQTAAPLPNVAAGVYLLRLDTANGTMVQKIVIK